MIGDIPPERTFSPLDIRAFGAANVEDLIQSLGSQVSSNRGWEDSGPVTLLNGRRVSDFSEIARIPTEAIERTEIFPEELALKYGYRADQKVVNIVTFASFTSRTGQLNYVVPTQGGRDTAGVVADYFAIAGDTRAIMPARITAGRGRCWKASGTSRKSRACRTSGDPGHCCREPSGSPSPDWSAAMCWTTCRRR